MFKRNVVTGKYNWWLKIYNGQFPNTVVLNRITDDIFELNRVTNNS